MHREIKIIKRAVLDKREAEREKVLSPACNTEVASPLQLARTIDEWVKDYRQRAREELAVARSFRTAF